MVGKTDEIDKPMYLRQFGVPFDALIQGYGEFKTEAHLLDPHYAPITVNTDAWDGTRQALLKLFPTVTLVLCFRN